MGNTVEKRKQKMRVNTILIKWLVYSTALLVLAGSAWYSAFLLSKIFTGGFSGDVFIYPLLMVKKMVFSTLIIILIIATLVYYGVKHKRLWYLIPVGIMLIAFYWYSINSSVHKAYIKRYGINK